MMEYIKGTILWSLLRNIYIKRNRAINCLIRERSKLFPGKVKLVDLFNARYISRKPIYDFLTSNEDKLKGDVLDFGCGSMEYRKILKKIHTYTGLDIEGAEKNGFIGDGNVIYYDGVHIPFDNEKFDSVLAVEVFEHVEELEKVLNEINRIMRKDGLMLFTVPMNFPLHLEPWDFRRFTKHGIAKMLHNTGFEIVQIKASTTTENTLRRLRIIADCSYKGFGAKLRLFIYNICFAFSNNVLADEKFPIDWLVICKKLSTEKDSEKYNI